ncbi:MAG: proline--tRNA ligase [Armatimonadota bacterium]|nr:proline--tRNA ligase [Armatimonadota bacterium]MDR7436261.1 proline--tRNA ligase [Armatimonadota bacterium]MDR7471359.1 proline--tRNA ligase [Armatimonadota bacterium]MDR7506429.1 proline--tRNA ligase [Armatimonadota bacterium]MDR7508984.1 proline--tRNA ligase [Armatimonadota bacterium]
MATEKETATRLPSKAENFSEWYTAVALRAELADYTPVRGFMAIRPYGYAIWEGIQAWLDRRFKDTGHQTAYFPLLVPESFLRKEAEHVQGFAPQVAWVTHGGDEPLAERLAVRPTSEAIILPMYARWIQSYRDLPVLLLQWNSVVRWEKSTRLFLRTAEFLWHEGHTAHRTAEDADRECRLILGIYRELLEDVLAIPVVVGTKPPSERFAGADITYTLEALMPDGQAIQAGTSHFLGQNFARAFEVKFLDADNREKYVWSTSWAVTTRLIGCLIMAHGDDRGLILPPRIAPYQVVIVPILGRDDERVLPAARALAAELGAEVRVRLDDRDAYTPGWKFHEWELRGVPVRLEVGPRDVEADQVVLVRRTGGGRQAVPRRQVAEEVRRALAEIQRELFDRARAYRDSHTTTAGSADEAAAALADVRGFVRVRWCRSQQCEDVLRERTGASPRVIPLDEEPEGACAVCGRPAQAWVYYARAY